MLSLYLHDFGHVQLQKNCTFAAVVNASLSQMKNERNILFACTDGLFTPYDCMDDNDCD